LCKADNKEKSKKRKKDKSHLDVQTENSTGDISSAVCDSLTKKKKKHRHQKDVVIAAMNITTADGDNKAVDAKDGEHEDKKSVKKRKCHSEMQSTTENADVLNTSNDLGKRMKTADGNNFVL